MGRQLARFNIYPTNVHLRMEHKRAEDKLWPNGWTQTVFTCFCMNRTVCGPERLIQCALRDMRPATVVNDLAQKEYEF